MLKKIRSYLAKDPIYFLILRKIIELNFRKEKKIIKEVFADQNGKKVLDIGCGTGEYSGLFNKNNYIGIDISPAYISYAKKAKDRDFRIMDAMNLSFPDEKFDIILIAAILHHLQDAEAHRVLKEAKRVLKKGGKALIMEDSKIKEFDSPFIRFVQSLDIGSNIRTPDKYKGLFSHYFKKIKEWKFRNGACTYYVSLMYK